MNTRFVFCALCAAIAGPATWAAPIAEVNAFYFGNSFTENSMYMLHPLLGKSAGKIWNCDVAGGPGLPSWTHMHRLMTGEGKHREIWKAFDGDTLVILIFAGQGLSFTTQTVWTSVKFDQPTHEEMEPLRKGFDYTAQWLTEDRSNYEESKKRFGEYVHIPDLGVHLDITPERAAAINDAIWSVVAGHPYTHVPQE